jgi:hypothetical protein
VAGARDRPAIATPLPVVRLQVRFRALVALTRYACIRNEEKKRIDDMTAAALSRPGTERAYDEWQVRRRRRLGAEGPAAALAWVGIRRWITYRE